MLLFVCGNCQKGIINNKAQPPDVSNQTHSWNSLAAQFFFMNHQTGIQKWDPNPARSWASPADKQKSMQNPQEVDTKMLLNFLEQRFVAHFHTGNVLGKWQVLRKWHSKETNIRSTAPGTRQLSQKEMGAQQCIYFRPWETGVSHPWTRQPVRAMWHSMVWNIPLDSSSQLSQPHPLPAFGALTQPPHWWDKQKNTWLRISTA